MRHLFGVMLIACVLLSVAPVTFAESDPEGFDHIPLIRDKDLDVTLLVRPVATPADAEFIGFLIHNKMNRLLSTDDAWYRIEDAKRLARGTQELISTSSLAQGNAYDLLHRDVMDINTTRPILGNEELRRMTYCSSYSMGLLGIPPQDAKGYTIQAKVRLEITVGKRHLATPPEGVPIQFDWLSPDAAGLQAMTQRLRDLLRGGDPGQRQYYAMSTLLDHPAISAAMTTPDLIAGLYAWEQGGGKILKYIDEHRKQDDGLVDYALGLIAKRDYIRMGVLQQSTSLHDARLIEPLRKWATDKQNNYGSESALTLLSRQLDLAPDRDALTAELGRVWLARSPITSANQFNAKQLGRWHYEVRLLALTRDRNLIPLLVPYLDRTDVVIDAREIAAVNSGISTRACDVAYNAIQDLLGRGGERFVLEIGMDALLRRSNGKDEYGHRNGLIAALKQELISR